MSKLCVFVALVALGVAGAAAADPASGCGVCQTDNDVYCESQTKFYYCMNGKKMGEPMHCPESTVCTNKLEICKTPDAQTPDEDVCAIQKGCNDCAGSKYTCVSETQFARCVASAPLATTYSCEEGEICVADNRFNTVCMPSCVANFLKARPSCGNEASTATTPRPGPTPNPTERAEVCKEASAGKTTTFFYAHYDETCKNYVYCQRNSLTSNDWTTFYGTCSAPTPYYDTVKKSCVATKPDNCQVLSTAAQTPSVAPTTPVTPPNID